VGVAGQDELWFGLLLSGRTFEWVEMAWAWSPDGLSLSGAN